jgi:RNA polymerase sigma factor (sigma-70 family)
LIEDVARHPTAPCPREPSALEVVEADTSFARRWTAARARGATRAELVRIAFDHHHPMVGATARLMLDDRHDAEDAVQSVFERFATKLDSVRDPERIPGFLKTMITRQCLATLQRRRWWLGRRGAVLTHELASEPLEPADATIVVAVRELLAVLSPAERVVVVLKFVEQMSLEEVAAAMEISISTVRRRLAAARTRMAGLALAPDDPRATLLRELPGDDEEGGT